MFQRVTSTPNLTSRRSLLTTLIHESDRVSALQNVASRSASAVHRSLALNGSIDPFSQKTVRNFYSRRLWLALVVILQYCIFTIPESIWSMRKLAFSLSKFFLSSSLDSLKSSRSSRTRAVPLYLTCFSTWSNSFPWSWLCMISWDVNICSVAEFFD